MDLEKIKTLIDFVGRSNVTELSVTEKDTTVRIFRVRDHQSAAQATVSQAATQTSPAPATSGATSETVAAPVFGILHRTPAPGEPPFVKVGDTVEEGQTLFIIEAMKVFNRITAPRAGRIIQLTDVDGAEVETGDMLAEIAG
ncbi:acetyl-CoA carboxylase biotin carboxyl carrier protein subunit [Sinorhizobium sp. BG8]|uniref:acetyl-CoA carboxylase biotin carboxyl carrier protein n=1 Tax=Sinorhizobium sp. BG8 TaxID=2613773 RepID=UPI00193E4C47|nr:acetyl-CoA carboxylase biotin carboxyl carrier protein subunit [Sinorhizobium sp. BG8]QRM57082.1 acetyl-CoA carboxylase biotin carboxyl carrier protein subunit [Sinorhizobium sp. BG8]